jgi:hypothetical protein
MSFITSGTETEKTTQLSLSVETPSWQRSVFAGAILAQEPVQEPGQELGAKIAAAKRMLTYIFFRQELLHRILAEKN